jgi:hypothetical protein
MEKDKIIGLLFVAFCFISYTIVFFITRIINPHTFIDVVVVVGFQMIILAMIVGGLEDAILRYKENKNNGNG